jgi:hypothetical protein
MGGTGDTRANSGTSEANAIKKPELTIEGKSEQKREAKRRAKERRG